MKPLISIIMPVYNCEDFIEESVRGILEQTYKNWELIIVDDGSQDKTLGKISNVHDERVHIIKMEKHLGLTAAFDEGYKKSKGDLIIRHDGDDISLPTRLELQQTYLDSNPKAEMVSCLISCFTRDPLYSKDCIFIERVQNNYLNFEDIKRASLGGFIPIIFPTLMIRRSLMDKVRDKKRELVFDDHFELLLDLIQVSSVEKIDTILYYYRRHKDAYHVVRQRDYEQYTQTLLKDPVVRDHIKYKDFYNQYKEAAEYKLISLNEKSQTRVLMLIDALNVGGTETHVLELTKRLIGKEIYVIVATSGGPMEALFQSYGIRTYKIPFDSDYISNKKKYGLIKLLKAIVDKEQINVIHCHLFASMQLASELNRIYHIPYITTIHGLFYPNDVLYSSCMRASTVIAVSEPVKKMLNSKLGNRIREKIHVIPNGVSTDIINKADIETDIRKELNIPPFGRILCYCSRLDWNKTEVARVVLFSISRLIQSIPNLYAIILGDGIGRESVEKEAQIINQMANRKIIHVIGAKANVIPYFLKSNLVIGTGRVALEAMMCKKPVIAIGNQGYVGIVNDKSKERQWQMYFGDHDAVEKPNVSKVTKDISYLLWNPQTSRGIGEWGKKWCEKSFNSEEVTNRTIEIYKKVLSLQSSS